MVNNTQSGLEQFRNEIGSINAALHVHLDSYPHQISLVKEAAAYSAGAPGHRWRPVLCVRIFKHLSPDSSPARILPVACAIEFLHTASIILDDLPVMDDASLRRGKKPCHLVFGSAPTILTAFWLCDVAQHLLYTLPIESREIENDFRAAKALLLDGQLRDLANKAETADEILDLCRLKSGTLYAFAASAPARLLGQDATARELSDFGNFLGTAYQISDDISDILGSTGQLGKDMRKDVGKTTLPLRMGMETAQKERASFREKAIMALMKTPAATEDMLWLIDEIIACDLPPAERECVL